MKHLLYILLFLSFSVFPQKKLEKEIPVAAAIETIYIDLNTVFSVSIKTHKKSYIKVVGESEGEYANNFVLQNKVENGSVLLSGSVSIGFVYPQDKLSAHKVHAITVRVLVPENKQVILTSDIANVDIEGIYESVFLNLYSGNVLAKNLNANAIIQTVSGDVSLSVFNGGVTAISKHGTVSQEKIPEGVKKYQVQTLTGNIDVVRENELNQYFN